MRRSVISAMHSSTVVSGRTTISGDDMISRTGVSLLVAALERHAAEVVALGDDSGDLAGLRHEQRTDVPRDHSLDRLEHGGACVDPENLAALLLEDLSEPVHVRVIPRQLTVHTSRDGRPAALTPPRTAADPVARRGRRRDQARDLARALLLDLVFVVAVAQLANALVRPPDPARLPRPLRPLRPGLVGLGR